MAHTQIGFSRVFDAGGTTTSALNGGSVLVSTFEDTLKMLPLRGHIGAIRCLMRGDYYVGLASMQRALPKNTYSVAKQSKNRLAELSNNADSIVSN